ncbi:hypothetical protein Z517_07185 [Fonsecaea pedrosoi CBS 271.37]|uniref:Unplaced genomic scaffold supercont1.4, whole genome shotgun sequence n=1 Tax=Fonsecaea pedrosoi CBS 271.37 TaxID=1442368 RepID=A0A0D2H7H2_9EURO|nr:uncharacterized protein Z517_07185 [Fonsecaea pedrosoi CBS 271.37]KIW80569.1 hypothetical protein Z517_07185 [Fonsecaea pedrosoi CBS 271.37]
MGRKLFLNHLAAANRMKIENIENVCGLEEGLFIFTYVHPGSSLRVTIEVFANDLGEYPDGNSFVLYTKDTSHDPIVAETLCKVTEHAHGKPVIDLLTEIAELLASVTGKGYVQENIGDDHVKEENDFDFDFESDSDIDLGTCQASDTDRHSDIRADSTSLLDDPNEKTEKVRADLAALKHSGFRVGVFGNITSGGILCISVRVSKLGLSDEALEAWNVPRRHYFLLLIRYLRGYLDATRVVNERGLSDSVEMRVGLCSHYKPSLREVLALYQYTKSDNATSANGLEAGSNDQHAFEALCIGNSINQLLEERVFKIISARELYQLSWLGAEKFINERQTSSLSNIDDMSPYHCDDDAHARGLPPIVVADHMRQNRLAKASLPLILMQFSLRHFVRCTEFCLVCHCRVDEGFGALKPYVCLKPLCLYQYMSLGFGPRLEWEIMVQPYVVDVLISLCYAAARSGRLKEFPIGMNLVVPVTPRPRVPRFVAPYHTGTLSTQAAVPLIHEKSFACTWYRKLRQLVIEQDEEKNISVQKLKLGDWLVLLCVQTETAAHCRVKEVELPRIWLDSPISIPFPGLIGNSGSLIETSGEDDFPVKADCYLYDKNFDHLIPKHQEDAIVSLLDTLPSVIRMRRYLESQGKSQDPSLTKWTDRISAPALNLLRWIVASNRSCILQVDDIGTKDDAVIRGKPEDRVGGMESWIQFRFAQGAPDKEKRFNNNVKQRASATGTNYPTIFAWHGSAIGNWHSIIRQGLRFDEVLHGRSYGNGIYVSPYARTSLQYTGELGSAISSWHGSVLKITRVLSLQEIVNDRASFRCASPHYVVPKVDWVQTRYLFVKTEKIDVRNGVAGQIYRQQPGLEAYNEERQPITIPLTAISRTRRSGSGIGMVGALRGKRTKTISNTNQATAERDVDDAESVLSDAQDLAVFQGAGRQDDGLEPLGSSTECPRVNGKKRPAEVAAETDFIAGQLDVTNIKFMAEPQDATPVATKALMRLLKDALKIQESTPPATLGWYIDRSLINNMYQWIVELHSFPRDLPLAQDMRNIGVASIVMEMRFTHHYPWSPPFIRVAKPRFLPFSQGGGGNVTEGGAMCMEVLTNNGWSASFTVESLLLQVRMALSDTQRPARLVGHPGSTYGVGEAKRAYIRACMNHGWKVPDGFATIQE